MSLWHPYAAPGAAPQLRLVRGEGSYIYDDQGRGYLDATSGLWNVTLGYGNRELIERMEAQLRCLAYGSLFYASNGPAEVLAQRLVDLSGGRMSHVYLSTSGTSAVEVALRVARLHHRARGQEDKRKILSLDRSYHGCSWLNLSASGVKRSLLQRWEEILPDFETIQAPYCYRCPMGLEPTSCQLACLDTLTDMLATSSDEIAALIVEPVIGSGGVLVPPEGYFRTVKDLCRQHEVLLIADEVATGLGRCGVLFASSLVDLEPDIVTLAKGLNAGHAPLGATLFSPAVVDPIRLAGAPLLYGSTQDGNPVACAAALASLDFIEEHNLLERSQSLGNWLRAQLTDLQETGLIAEVRGLGLMLGIEMVHDAPKCRPYTMLEAAALRQRCCEEGLLVYHFESGLSLYPPLTMLDAEAEDLVEMLQTVLEHPMEIV